MIHCSVQDILQATGGKLLQGNLEDTIAGITTDSRNCQEGQLFIPLVGPNFDGHDYIGIALRQGCSGCLSSRENVAMTKDKFYIYVQDTRLALKNLAIWYRAHFHIPFVQITGSTGKTTTKEMVAHVLSKHFTTFKTEANFNNDIGVPQMILRMEDTDEAAVLETGMNHFGEIRYLGEMVRPNIAIITNIGDAHREFLGNSREGVLKAKIEIFENLQDNGLAILNGDDPLLAKLNLSRLRFRKILYGTRPNCDVRIEGVRDYGIEGLRFRIITKKGSYSLQTSVPGGYLAHTAAIAIAVGEELGMSAEEMIQGISEYQHVGNRMQVIRKSSERMILNDCYNASPQAMEEAIRILGITPSSHHMAVLGDMGEIGDLTESAHKQLGRLCERNGIDTIIAIGDKARFVREGTKKRVYWFDNLESAKPILLEKFTPGTACLIKASHSMHFEKLVEYLKNDGQEVSTERSIPMSREERLKRKEELQAKYAEKEIRDREQEIQEEEDRKKAKREALRKHRKEIAQQRVVFAQKKIEGIHAKRRLKETRKQKLEESKREASKEQKRRADRNVDEDILQEERTPKDVLFLYYSRTGYTRRTMTELCEALDGDIVAISDTRNRKGILGYLRCGMDAMRLSTLPTKKIALLQPLEQYKLVLIGTPIWAGRCASPVRSFLKRHGLEMERTAYVLIRNGIRKYETVYAQMDVYTAKPHLFGISLRPGDEGYAFWKNQFIRDIKNYLEENYAGETEEN